MDSDYISKLSVVALRHGASVNVHPNMATYKAGKTRFSAEISGFSIPWHGGMASCIATLKEIQRIWEGILITNGAKGVAVVIENLPM